MPPRASLIRWAGVPVTLSLLAGCGGHGPPAAPAAPAVPHDPATLALTADLAPEIAAQAVAVLSSLRTLGYGLVGDLESVSPAAPVKQEACGGGGSTSVSYEDDDHSGTRTPGDRITLAAPGCAVAALTNGGATATVLAVEGGDLADVRVVIDGGTLPYLESWNWVPALTGTLRMTAGVEEIRVRSEGALVFTLDANKSFRASNLELRLRDDRAQDPPAPGIVGGLDIRFDTPAAMGASVAVDTVGLVAGHAPNVAPAPGALTLQGSGGSQIRVADAKPASPGWFLVATDADGDGRDEATSTISFAEFFDAL